MSASDRAVMVEWLRSEVMGPHLSRRFPEGGFKVVDVPANGQQLTWPFTTIEECRPLFYHNVDSGILEEIISSTRETPRSRYGVGVLWPGRTRNESPAKRDSDDEADEDVIGPEADAPVPEEEDTDAEADGNDVAVVDADPDIVDKPAFDVGEEFEVTSTDRFKPSTMGLTFFVKEGPDGSGRLVIRLPRERTWAWQEEKQPIPLNGWYEPRQAEDHSGEANDEAGPRMRRLHVRRPAVPKDCENAFTLQDFTDRESAELWELPVATGCPLQLSIELYPRKVAEGWLVTVVLRNREVKADGNGDADAPGNPAMRCLFQAYFEVAAEDGAVFLPYREPRIAEQHQDEDERSLFLLYQDYAVWGIGHGCAAGWDEPPGSTPHVLYADVLPAVETASMTPDVEINGQPLSVRMATLMQLPPWDQQPEHEGWVALQGLIEGYSVWITGRNEEIPQLDDRYKSAADRHMNECGHCHKRMQAGLQMLKSDALVLDAFRLANEAMLLQQVATKHLKTRPLTYDPQTQRVVPTGSYAAPDQIVMQNGYGTLGSWRAFQIAFLLMSLAGCADETNADRETVDLIWFPTGGGKTEAYLAVAAFMMLHQRLLEDKDPTIRRDGCTVLMRYTLRMLTTQQFQRAAALVCAMERLRRRRLADKDSSLGESRPFSLGLWAGGKVSPNTVEGATTAVELYRRNDRQATGNPLVLTECPWCRARLDRYHYDAADTVPPGFAKAQWFKTRVPGVFMKSDHWRVRCSDPGCPFHAPYDFIPVQVVDQTLYEEPPSILIGTVDKFAQLAFRHKARSIFGRRQEGAKVLFESRPPSLILQDELHLIAGPLGTIFALYEAAIEHLCCTQVGGETIKPKIICSTATVRGACEQIRALFARTDLRLFPPPGLTIADSFFGTYAKRKDGQGLDHGRLYLGVHATNYPSMQTTQAHVFSRVLQGAEMQIPENGNGLPEPGSPHRKDPWWTLLVFYNSLRELGGAGMLFYSDVPGRMRFLRARDARKRRSLRFREELSSRLDQAKIVDMLDRLAIPYRSAAALEQENTQGPIDVARASSIIEVGVDIDRLSLMAVVGQPKTTAQYIQVTGRVGRRWGTRPGLVITLLSPQKSRDRSHYEQFHGYHRRLYERVEPASATPFAVAAIDRALAGTMTSHIRQAERHREQNNQDILDWGEYKQAFEDVAKLLRERAALCEPDPVELKYVNAALDRVIEDFRNRWQMQHTKWHKWCNLQTADRPLLRTFGQQVTYVQKDGSVQVPNSMRHVDLCGELQVTQISPSKL